MHISINIDNEDIKKYFVEIRKTYLTSDYTEHSYRTPFENLIKHIHKEIKLIHEPKRTKGFGAPDFKAFRGIVNVGYIETKNLDSELDKIVMSEQIKRYREAIDNLILTNYSRFILFRKEYKQPLFDISLFKLTNLENPQYRITEVALVNFQKLIETFFNYEIEPITSAEELSKQLSKKAKLLKILTKEQLLEDKKLIENNKEASQIYDFYESLKYLMINLNIDDCADAFSQTITYGLFLAKYASTSNIKLATAANNIPKNIGIIYRLFRNISDINLNNISWIVEDIIDILNSSDLKTIINQIQYAGVKDRDPFTFFYEDFLSYYDPTKRKKLGVYYTPRPVITFIVESVNKILKNDFKKIKGFAEDEVTVLDPAVGTGTFLWKIYTEVINGIINSGLEGILEQKIENHILKHFYGFEILITPYVIAHLKLITILHNFSYNIKPTDRIQIYLTDTLGYSKITGIIPFAREIDKENKIANKIKESIPILVVLGNPPYSSSKKRDIPKQIKDKTIFNIDKLMDDYKQNLYEQNIQPLSDDYIKFIRFAQEKINRNEHGIIAYISNNSFLDGVIHRQMRKSLLKSFNKIYIINLHGDANKGEKCPDGSKDENVFDIKQGVGISIFIKFKDNQNNKIIKYFDLYGLRAKKYEWLKDQAGELDQIEWKDLDPGENYCFFVPFEVDTEYENYFSLTDIFKNYNSGIVTGRDEILTAIDKGELVSRMREIFDSEDLSKYPDLKSNKTGRKIISYVKKLTYNEKCIKKYHYRPFDIRYIYYQHDPDIMERNRYTNIIFQLFKKNIALITSRLSASDSFENALVTDLFPDYKLGDRTRGSYIFPLYDYSDIKNQINIEYPNYRPKYNFKENFVLTIKSKYPKRKLTNKLIFSYIYGILFSPFYRRKYANYLKIDFPRIPFPNDFDDLKEISKLGKKLIELHLMKKSVLSYITFPIAGSNIIEKIEYKKNRIYINQNQYFDNVEKDIWTFNIGGYEILERYLKDRLNRKLKSNDVEHILKVGQIIKVSIEIMKEIDKFIFF